MGLNENIISSISSYISNRKSYVCCNDACSVPVAVHSGEAQRSVVGPLLFLLYVNDIANGVPPAVQIKLFADDCMVFSKVRTFEDQGLLNAALEKLRLWCNTWDMIINFNDTVL